MSGKQREEYWKNRIQPFWQEIWPKSQDCINPRIAQSLTQLSIAAGNEFPTALSQVKPWLRKIENPMYLVHLMQESDLSTLFPKDTLLLLDAIIGNISNVSDELKDCLDKIKKANPGLEKENEFQRIEKILRQKNIM